MSDNIEECYKAWTADFGDEYTLRNQSSEDDVQNRGNMLLKILNELPCSPQSIVEIGAGGGANLRALRRILGNRVDLHAVEPNEKARGEIIDKNMGGVDCVLDGTASKIPFPDTHADMVFTSGVLIHIPPEELSKALDEIYRVTKKWIVAIEYFNPSLVSAPYRGLDNLMWKADYGSLYLDRFPDLHCIAWGFEWKRMTGLDNVTWWLLKKCP